MRHEKQRICLELGITFHVECAPWLTGGVTTIHLQPAEHDPHTLPYTFLKPDILRLHQGAHAALLLYFSAFDIHIP